MTATDCRKSRSATHQPTPMKLFKPLISGGLCVAVQLFAAQAAGGGSPSQDRTLLWFGVSGMDQRLIAAGDTNVISAAIGGQGILARRPDGRVVLAESDQGAHGFQPPGTLTNAILVTASGNAADALRSNGLVASWGVYARPAPRGLSNVVAFAVGSDVDVALRSDGTVVSWRDSDDHTPVTVPPDLRDVIAVSASAVYGSSLALRGDGTVAAWDHAPPETIEFRRVRPT
jgi:hypothetical protein